ncbi:putative virion structural protein [Erwinia phage pEa_SNUABM_8]|nr:putative virion structural protein [Erwinia phage pEa_SNUABM_8]QVW54928.1 hypothetical protein pEaSNUABM4_00175 [Erwinia phage pEa_SNUABM_4]
MGVKLKWDLQVTQNLDAIEIYRSNNPIDFANPGTPLVTLAGTATEFEDFTVKNKNLYYYRIAAKKGAERGWGENQLTGYFSETGPGRAYPLRGDWNAGLMDILPQANLITMPDFFAKLPQLSKFGGVSAGITSWYKTCYKGKVIFVPSGPVLTASWSELYGAKAIFGEDSSVQLPNGTLASGKLTVDINGLTYIVRCPKLSPLPYSTYLTTQDQTLNSEWRDTVSRLCLLSTEPQPGAKSRLFDLGAAPATVLGGHIQTTVNCSAILPAAPGALSYGAMASRYAVGLVLELVMP